MTFFSRGENVLIICISYWRALCFLKSVNDNRISYKLKKKFDGDIFTMKDSLLIAKLQ